MSNLDPGLVIVIAAALVLAAFGLGALARRRAALRRLALFRTADRMELHVVSPTREALIVCVLCGPLVFGVPFVAMALGDFGRANALPFTLVLLALVAVAVVGPKTYAARWARAGRVTLHPDALHLSTTAGAAAIDLREPFELREGFVPPGQRTESVVAVVQRETVLTFRYPVFFGANPLAPPGAVCRPEGALLGPEARALHERLREADHRG